MRIILVQAEIEEALRSYVLNQISVKPGQDISITFKNTRGDDGATAEIDITAPVASPLGSKPTAFRAPDQGESGSILTDSDRVKNTCSVNQEGNCPAPAAEASSDTTDQEPPFAEDASTTSEAEPEEETKSLKPEVVKNRPVQKPQAEAETAGEEIPPPSKSLFGNLTKPVNAKS